MFSCQCLLWYLFSPLWNTLIILQRHFYFLHPAIPPRTTALGCCRSQLSHRREQVLLCCSCGRFSGCGAGPSVLVAPGPSCSSARGTFPDQGLNLCPLPWQAGSHPLDHWEHSLCIFNHAVIHQIFITTCNIPGFILDMGDRVVYKAKLLSS